MCAPVAVGSAGARPDKCTKCDAPLKATAKCCVMCGLKVADMTVAVAPSPRLGPKGALTPRSSKRMSRSSKAPVHRCVHCSAKLKSAAIMFCTKCGGKQGEASTVPVATTTTSTTTKGVSSDCASCKAPLKPGMSFCTKCGTKVGASANTDQQRERRVQAAEKAEKMLLVERRKMEAEEEEKISHLTNQSDVAQVRAESAARLREKEEQFVANLVAEDDLENESFAEMLLQLESKAQDAEEELLAAMQSLPDNSKHSDSNFDAMNETRSRTATPKVLLSDFDPSKYGLASFESLFENLSTIDEDLNPGASMTSARSVISQGEKIRSQIQQDRSKRIELETMYNNTTLDDDLEKELRDLMDVDDDIVLDDEDFANVGGIHVRRTYIDSDDESSE